MMNCPDCSNPLEPGKIGSVSVEECRHCKGIWLDRGELEAAGEEIEPDLSWMDFELWRDPRRFQADRAAESCPKCDEKAMTAVDYGDSGIRIHYCAACGGVWLRSGQLSRIVAHMAAEADEKEAADYLRASLKEAGDLIANPANAASEWRDLKHVLRLLKYRFFVENPRLKNILAGIQKSLPL
jgi:Zn-finger nucleic acid-binding protein